MKVLVTGHRGFIGRYVFADWRSTEGYKVHGIDHPDHVVPLTLILVVTLKKVTMTL